MYYRSELFYRLHTVDIKYRARLYHYACKLAQHDAVMVSATDTSCSIWVSLRSPSATASNLRHQKLPPFMDIAEEGDE